jgi:hypothetical protein
MRFKWLKRGEQSPIDAWRARWHQAVQTLNATEAEWLRSALKSGAALGGEDLEIEQEMLDGLDRLLALTAEIATGRLPRIETAHRVVGADICHFSAPASVPDDHSQASGRVLLTSTRAVFAGGAKLAPVPWHAVREIASAERDVLLIRSADSGVRFRFNNYGDAMVAAALAKRLKRPGPL